MNFGQRLKERRMALGLSRNDLAARLGITPAAISNYESNISFPKEEILLRLFDCVEADPNTLFQDSFRGGGRVMNFREEQLLRDYRSLNNKGQQTVHTVVESLCDYRDSLEKEETQKDVRMIPLYQSPAAAGYAAPVFGEDFDYLPVTGDVPPAAEFAVRIQGDSMAPWIEDKSVVYVNRDPLRSGDVGIFCVDGNMLCKQYHRDPAGVVYLLSMNRERADADVILTPESGRTLVCFGRVIIDRRQR